MSKSVLITGGAGFIGSHVADELLARGYRVRALDSLSTQVHGAAGVTQFTPLASMYASMRTLRIADGPDEVHKMTIARREILRHDPNFRMNPVAAGSSSEGEPQPFARP